MPITPTYPGVYIEELPSEVRTITGVATSITAFVGRALSGPVDEPRRITSWADFQRIYGGLWRESMMSYAVFHFYQNGGTDAIIVRIHNLATPARIDLKNGVILEADNPGDWGNRLRARVEHDRSEATLYNLTVRDTQTGLVETFRNVSTDATSSNSLDRQLRTSTLVTTAPETVLTTRPEENTRLDNNSEVPFGTDPFSPNAPENSFTEARGGNNGQRLEEAQYRGNRDRKTGIYALLNTDIFNLLVIPPIDHDTDLVGTTLPEALQLCVERRAMLILDPPKDWRDLQTAYTDFTEPPQNSPLRDLLGANATNAAIYFPRVRMADPEQNGLLEEFPASGIIAGIFARTDAQRGVWKAPAGTEASLNGVRELTVRLNDRENGQLNPLGLNSLRTFPVIGNVVWGARTLQGADQLASQWKYVPVRRIALYIEESLYRGTQWVVFEPNDEPLWSQIRLNVGAFMQDLFRQGAFQGTSPRDAVNVVVGFAPLKPAEFVIIKIQQMAGQVQT
jgi:uncharacterized protein